MQIEYPRQSASQTIDQLLAIGVLTDRHIVDGGVRISFRESRNAVSIVEISDTYGFVCKIGTRQWWETESKIVAEARFYRYVWHDPSFVQLQAFVPRLVDYDPASSRLIVTACLPEMSLHDLWFRPKGKEPSRFAALGRALKRVRSVGKAVVQGRHPFGRIGSTQPWIINLATGRFFPVPASNAAARVLSTAQNSRALMDTSRVLEKFWNYADLIHGDMRLSNVLVSKSHEFLNIVDWELSGWGDSLWDAGALLGSMLAASCVQIASISQLPQAMAELAEVFRSFFANYEGESRVSDQNDIACRVVQYAGLRLVQCAFEYAQIQGTSSDRSLLLVSNAEALCRDPYSIAQQFAS